MNNLTAQQLSPSLWRTCRVIANRRRLGLLKLLADGREKSVSAIAHEARLTLPLASQSLRALNARGFLRVRRKGRHTYYRIGADPLLRDAGPLLNALMSELKRKSIDSVFRQATATTHPTRVEIIKLLHQRPGTVPDIRERLGTSPTSTYRHLRKLAARDIVARDGNVYALSRRVSRWAGTVIRIAAG